MEIHPLDVGNDRVMSAAYAIECAANQRVRPGWRPLGEDARILGWRSGNGWTNTLLGAWDGTTLLGFAAGMTADDAADTTWIFVWVEPKYQNAGVGSALARAAEAASPPTAKRFVASAYRPEPAAIDALTRRFSEPMGYAAATTETVVELDLLTAPVVASKAPAGYDICTYVNGVPERCRTQVGQIKGLVDAEAPNGDLAWNETPVSPAEYAAEMALWTAQGYTVFETLAVDSAGNVAAWTCLLAGSDAERPAQIEGTLVLGRHRGRGLGAAVKRACLKEAKETAAVEKVRTSSDDTNTWMRSINAQLGFLPVEVEVILQKERGPR